MTLFRLKRRSPSAELFRRWQLVLEVVNNQGLTYFEDVPPSPWSAWIERRKQLHDIGLWNIAQQPIAMSYSCEWTYIASLHTAGVTAFPTLSSEEAGSTQHLIGMALASLNALESQVAMNEEIGYDFGR